MKKKLVILGCLNIILNVLLIFYSYLFFDNNNSAFILIPFSFIMVILMLMTILYHNLNINSFKEIKIDGFIKLVKILIITIVLPYSAEWKLLYFIILAFSMIIDYYFQRKLYARLKLGNYVETTNFVIDNERGELNITLALLFSHTILLLFLDTKISIKIIAFFLTTSLIVGLLQKLYLQYKSFCSFTNFLKGIIIFIICFAVTSFMFFKQQINFLYYFAAALSISGFWRIRKWK